MVFFSEVALSHISVATSAFSCLLFAWCVIFCPLTFNFSMFLCKTHCRLTLPLRLGGTPELCPAAPTLPRAPRGPHLELVWCLSFREQCPSLPVDPCPKTIISRLRPSFPGFRGGRADPIPPDSVVAEDGVASLAFLKDVFAGRKIPGWQLRGLCPAVFRRCHFRWEGRRHWRDPSSVCRASRFFADLEIFISSAHGCGG